MLKVEYEHLFLGFWKVICVNAGILKIDPVPVF